jgi:hypothetical protein
MLTDKNTQADTGRKKLTESCDRTTTALLARSPDWMPGGSTPGENAGCARKIIDYCTDKGVDCSVVDEHLSLLITLSEEGRSHQFRYDKRNFAWVRHCKKFCMALDRELLKLKTQ